MKKQVLKTLTSKISVFGGIRGSVVVRKFPMKYTPLCINDVFPVPVQSIRSSLLSLLRLRLLMEFIAPAHMSHPGTPDTEVRNSLSNPDSIFSLFPPAKSLCSSDSSLSNQSLIPDFYDYHSISSFFPPDGSRSSSVSSAAETQHLSPYNISSFFPPTHSQGNSISSEISRYGFANSIPSIFQPNHSFSSIESTHEGHDHDNFINELFHGPHKPCWLSFNSDKIIAVPQEVEAEFEQAGREGWTYAMFWKKDWPDSYGHNTMSAVRGFYNEDDYRFKPSSFLLTRSWPGNAIHYFFNDMCRTWDSVDYSFVLSSKRARQGHKAGLKTMSWIPIANGFMEFGSTQLIDQHVTNKWFVTFGSKKYRLSIPPERQNHLSRNLDMNEVS